MARVSNAALGVGPDDAIPDGFSFDIDKPSYRNFKNGKQLLQYAIKGDTLDIDWVEGGGLASMLKQILAKDGAGIRRITGYTTDRLGELSDGALLRFGNQVASSLGEGWKATIRFEDAKRYLDLIR